VTFLLALLILILLTGVMAVPSAWLLMLLLGALSHLTGWPTAIGFWACYVITIILTFFVRARNND
jgi:hypothetical protein